MTHARGVFDADLLSRCISCGFCLPACPTYQLSGDEAASPRGRITLMRALESGDLAPDDPTLREQSSLCLGCRACEPVCPAGVQYGQLLEQWRVHQWRGRRRPLLARLIMAVAAREPVLRLLGRLRRAARTKPADGAQGHLMLGCFERALFPTVSWAVLRLHPGLTVPPRQGCCGALHAHNGDLAAGEAMARRLGRTIPGRIVTTSGGCAAHLATVLGRHRVSELSQILNPNGLAQVSIQGRRARVTLQDSCHLRNGLGVAAEPRALVQSIADFVELPDAGGCCGAAGTYSLLRPRDSRRLLARKLNQIAALDVDYVVTVNPGCQRQLQAGLRRTRSRTRAVHLAELLVMSMPGRSRAPGRQGARASSHPGGSA